MDLGNSRKDLNVPPMKFKARSNLQNSSPRKSLGRKSYGNNASAVIPRTSVVLSKRISLKQPVVAGKRIPHTTHLSIDINGNKRFSPKRVLEGGHSPIKNLKIASPSSKALLANNKSLLDKTAPTRKTSFQGNGGKGRSISFSINSRQVIKLG